MYLPAHFEQSNIEAMHELMRAYPLATLITHGSNGLSVNHVPLYLSTDAGQFGVLSGHVPKANPVWRDASSNTEVVVVFQGPQAYISPSWYASKPLGGKVVPTWNYTVVHAHGEMRAIEDGHWIAAHLEQLTDRLEAQFEHPWSVSDVPGDFTEKLLAHLVGIEISISKLQGKWKVSQNRPAQDRQSVARALRERDTTDEALMADLVEGDKR